jgi:hypothetical protein
MKKNFLWKEIAAVLIYRLILDISYILVISKLFEYEHYILSPNGLKIFESYFFLIIIFILLKTNFKLKERILPSQVLLFLLFLISYVPFLSLYALADKPRSFFYGATSFWMLVAFLNYIFPEIRIKQLRDLRDSKFVYLFFTLTANLLGLFLIFKYLGFSLNLNLSIVYDIRSTYIEARIPFGGYLFMCLSYAINPIFLSYSFVNKRWINVILIFFVQLILFSQTGMKSFLFVPFFVIGIAWLLNKRQRIIYWIPFVLSLLIVLGIFSYYIIGDVWISSLFTRRSLYTPASLSFMYYDFFSKNGFTYLSSHHLFGSLLKYPYPLNPPHLIGFIYFNSPEAGANNGIMGDAYMNFGFLGFFLWSFVLVLILKIINSVSKGKGARITASSFAVAMLYLSNSALLTSLLTHGLVVAILFTYLLPESKKDE